ncbi:MAG: RNA repair transcriptional activator RtcR family protein [Hyalangium sp.]|uniref:RNA repair transcriptional activator RtcR family protein n=1 Tax=Hyalangium sp. TaxID=2028555 RepID=UPI003899CB0E
MRPLTRHETLADLHEIVLPVLLSWVAKKNDPFDALPSGEKAAPSTTQLQPGPTLTLLFDDSSPFKGQVEDIVLLYRVPPPSQAASGDRPVFEATKREIAKRDPRIRVQQRTWAGDDPTNHQTLFEFLRELLPRLRQEFPGRELLIHISPGTPVMQTLWVLLAECGFIEQPFRVVKSYRKHERGKRASRGAPLAVGLPLQPGRAPRRVGAGPHRPPSHRAGAHPRPPTFGREGARLHLPLTPAAQAA